MSYMWQGYTKYKCGKDFYGRKNVHGLFLKDTR